MQAETFLVDRLETGHGSAQDVTVLHLTCLMMRTYGTTLTTMELLLVHQMVILTPGPGLGQTDLEDVLDHFHLHLSQTNRNSQTLWNLKNLLVIEFHNLFAIIIYYWRQDAGEPPFAKMFVQGGGAFSANHWRRATIFIEKSIHKVRIQKVKKINKKKDLKTFVRGI